MPPLNLSLDESSELHSPPTTLVGGAFGPQAAAIDADAAKQAAVSVAQWFSIASSKPPCWLAGWLARAPLDSLAVTESC